MSNNNEQLILMKMSQYDMLNDTVKSIVNEGKDPSALGEILESMKSTIEDIYALRNEDGEKEKNEIPRRKRNRDEDGVKDDVKFVDPQKFFVDAKAWLGIPNSMIKGVNRDYRSENIVNLTVTNGCVVVNGDYVPILAILDVLKSYTVKLMELGDRLNYEDSMVVHVYDDNNELLYTEIYEGCIVQDYTLYNGYYKDYYSDDNRQQIGVKIKYDKLTYKYGDKEC